jgi:hypothetical protein
MYKKNRAISDPTYIDFISLTVSRNLNLKVKVPATFLRNLIAPQFLGNLNGGMIH